MPRRKRDLKKTPKFLMPKTYREFLLKAMEEESRANASGQRPVARFSEFCLRNIHDKCSGWVTVQHGKDSSRLECLCHCHDSNLVV